MDTYYIDGQYVDEDNCVLSVKDIIVLRGFGVFDFLITYNKRPFYLKEHVQRVQACFTGRAAQTQMAADVSQRGVVQNLVAGTLLDLDGGNPAGRREEDFQRDLPLITASLGQQRILGLGMTSPIRLA